MVDGWCVRCKKSVPIKDGKEVVWKNGMKAMKGKCPNCNTTVNCILGKAQIPYLFFIFLWLFPVSSYSYNKK